jgi:hypothetical protein
VVHASSRIAVWATHEADLQPHPEPRAQVRILLGAPLLGAPCDLSGHRNDLEPTSGFGFGVLSSAGCSGRGPGWAAGGLVVAFGVEGELAEEFAGGGVDDADVEAWTSRMMWVRAWVRPRPMW